MELIDELQIDFDRTYYDAETATTDYDAMSLYNLASQIDDVIEWMLARV